MAQISINCGGIAQNFGNITMSVGSSSATIVASSFKKPNSVTSLPRISSGQADGDTLTLDTASLSPVTYQWQEFVGSWSNITGATSASYDTTGNGHAGNYVRCVTDAGTSPAVLIYTQMMEAGHNADDLAVLELVPHHEATHIAVTNGDWDSVATWLDNRVPRAGAKVLIPHEVTVTYTHTGLERLAWLRIDGTLNWALDQSTKIICETIIVDRGGILTSGTPGNRLPSQYTAEFIISNRNYDTSPSAPGDLDFNNDPGLFSRGIINLGSRVMWGAEKTHWLRTRCQFELAGTLSDVAETSVVLTETIPSTLASSGVFQVVDNSGEYVDLTYTSYLGDTLTISSADFSSTNAAAGNKVYISFAPQAGDTTVTLAKDATGWEVGDLLVVGGTNPTTSLSGSETEEVTVIGVNGSLVTFTPALAHTHDHKNSNVTRADLQPGVGNLTRNIKIYSERGDTVPVYRRGHTMDMHTPCHQDLWEVEHYDLGRTEKNVDGPFSGKVDSSDDTLLRRPTTATGVTETVPLTAQSNLQSRYPIHGHFVGRLKVQKDTINGCTVRNAPGWGIAHHAGEQFISGCVVYGFAGAGIVSETGDEIGEWVNNLCVKSINRIANNPKVTQAGAGISGDDSRHGYGFSSRGRAFRSANNFAMDCSSGHVYVHRQANGITPNRNLPNDALDFGDLRGVGGGSDTILHHSYPIIHNNFAEAAGVLWAGLYVTKENPEQEHGIAVNFIAPKVWATDHNGIDLEYVAHYIVTDADCVGVQGGANIGILFSQNTHQMAAVNSRVEDFTSGIAASGGIVPATPRYNAISTYSTTTDPLHITAGTKAINCTNAESLHPLAVSLSSMPAAVAPSTDLPFSLGQYNGNATLINCPTGIFTDTFNAASQLPRPNDSLGVPVNNDNNLGSFVQGYMDLLGGYDVIDGVNYLLFPMYFTDRLTGVPLRQLHGVELLNTAGRSPRRTWSRGANTITVNSGNPVQFNINTSSQSSETVNILALASDTAGATLSFALNQHNTDRITFFNPDHGRLKWDGAGSVTYTPDLGYTGSDRGWLWIEDDIGNCQQVDLVMIVT